MNIFGENFFLNLLGTVVAILAVTVASFKWRFTYWNRRGLPSLPSTIPFGTVPNLFLRRKSLSDEFLDIYKTIRAKGLKHVGIFFAWKPFYVPVDITIIKDIIQTDFQHFLNHAGYYNEMNDPLSAHLFNLQNDKWRKMRVKLTPTFTSGKMKMMFQIVTECARGLERAMEEYASDKKAVNIKEVLGDYTTDVIGSCAFGMQLNSLKNPDSDFRRYGKRIFEVKISDHLKNFAEFFMPYWFLDLIKMKLVSGDAEKFFLGMVKDTVDYRERNNIYRKDFMHLLLQLKNKGFVTDDGKIKEDSNLEKITLNELSAQAFVFFIAGFETSSTTMTFTLFELASNPNIQDKARKEITDMFERHDNQLTYEGMMKLTYLEKVIQETLRKYPPLGVLPRQCTKDYIIPNTKICIEKGTFLMIPILGIHCDPEFYPDPDKFDPERFSEENKRTRPALAWMPFGGGPRMCIGFRFAMMQTKVGLITLLNKYIFSLNEKTKVPLVMDTASFIATVEGGIWLNAKEIK